MEGEQRLSSELMWRATLVVAVLDAPLLILLGRGVSRSLFQKLKWHLVGATVILYAALWGVLASGYYWQSVYAAVFPQWARWLLPVAFGPAYGACALGFWALAVGTRRWPAVWFALMGGGVSLLGHWIGIRRGLLRVPLLAEVSPASALSFGVVEFICYWCVIVGVSVASRRAWVGLRGEAQDVAPARRPPTAP